MVDNVGQQLQTAFSNMLTLLFAGRLKKSVSLAGAKVLLGTNEHQRRFGVRGLVGGHLPAWSKRQCTYVRRMVCGLEVTWLLREGGVVVTAAMQAEVALQRSLLGLGEGVSLAALPPLLSTQLGLQAVVSLVNSLQPGKVAIADVKLALSGPFHGSITLKGVTVHEPPEWGGQQLLAVQDVECTGSLWQLYRGAPNHVIMHNPVINGGYSAVARDFRIIRYLELTAPNLDMRMRVWEVEVAAKSALQPAPPSFTLLHQPATMSLRFTPALSRFGLASINPLLGRVSSLSEGAAGRLHATFLPDGMSLPYTDASVVVDPMKLRLAAAPLVTQLVAVEH
ncbi:uncharacterized protein HaLaN_25725 [Haematococcus lacustris]|uniref:Uncharacterized protein n=1 Tax=Haematococcus lacustris TaxID=44745 RepID=A0A6A0A4M6_HAELA|nr:uncharacterized protein HaLaN_25725 [Haematococcus lacustris]